MLLKPSRLLLPRKALIRPIPAVSIKNLKHYKMQPISSHQLQIVATARIPAKRRPLDRDRIQVKHNLPARGRELAVRAVRAIREPGLGRTNRYMFQGKLAQAPAISASM